LNLEVFVQFILLLLQELFDSNYRSSFRWTVWHGSSYLWDVSWSKLWRNFLFFRLFFQYTCHLL